MYNYTMYSYTRKCIKILLKKVLTFYVTCAIIKTVKREAIIMMINLMFGAIIFKFFQMLIKF